MTENDVDRRAAVIRKVTALLAKTVANGCTEAEAMAAADLASRLMAEYELSLSDLRIREQANCMEGRWATGFRDPNQPAFRVMVNIGRLFDVKPWLDTDGNGRKHAVFYGFETDVTLATYVYRIIDRAITFATIAYKGTAEFKSDPSRRRHLQQSFEYGMTDRINARLRDMKSERVREAASAGRDLVVVKMNIVNEEFANHGIKLKAGKKHKPVKVDNDAYLKGQIEAEKVQFNKGLGESGKAEKIR